MTSLVSVQLQQLTIQQSSHNLYINSRKADKMS